MMECQIEFNEIKTKEIKEYLSNRVKYETGGRRRETDQRNMMDVSNSVPRR